MAKRTLSTGRAQLRQFVAGLLPEIKRRVVGVEGSFDQLLVKARFEEAKRRDLLEEGPGSKNHQPSPSRWENRRP